jgi:hypothetical protein
MMPVEVSRTCNGSAGNAVSVGSPSVTDSQLLDAWTLGVYAFCPKRLLQPLSDVIAQRILRGTWTIGIPVASIGLSATGGDIVMPDLPNLEAVCVRAESLSRLVEEEREDMLHVHKTGTGVSNTECYELPISCSTVDWLVFMSGLDADKCGPLEREGLIKCAYLMVARATPGHCFALPNRAACVFTRGVWGHLNTLTRWHQSDNGFVLMMAALHGTVRGGHTHMLSEPSSLCNCVSAAKLHGNVSTCPTYSISFFGSDLAASAIPPCTKIAAYKSLLRQCVDASNMLVALNIIPADSWTLILAPDHGAFRHFWEGILTSLVRYSDTATLVLATKEVKSSGVELDSWSFDHVACRIVARGDLDMLQAFHKAAYSYHQWQPSQRGLYSLTDPYAFWQILMHDSLALDSFWRGNGSRAGKICQCLDWCHSIGLVTLQAIGTAVAILSKPLDKPEDEDGPRVLKVNLEIRDTLRRWVAPLATRYRVEIAW